MDLGGTVAEMEGVLPSPVSVQSFVALQHSVLGQ